MTGRLCLGLTRDFLGEDGTPIFDPAALDILRREPRIEFEFMPHYTPAITPEQAARYDIIILLRPDVTAQSVSGNDRRLFHIARFGVGYDNIDVSACTEAGVLVTITPAGVRRPVATMSLTFVLALAQKLLIKDRLTREGRWADRIQHMGMGLTGRVLSSIGLGNTGSELFRLARPLDMRFMAFDPHVRAEDARALGVELVDLDTMLRAADFVCINCPLTPETKGLVGARELALMKPTAYVVNTARGPIIDERALYVALVERRIAGAALDVFETEPATADNPLFKLDTVIVTPHALCWTDELFRGCAEAAFHAAVAVARGERPDGLINPDVLARAALKPLRAAF